MFGNNPIWSSDPLGDTWRVGTDANSKKDVASLTRDKNQKYVKIGENGNVTLDFGKMSQNKINKLLKKDDGLSLINTLVNAKDASGKDLNFFYSVSPEGMRMYSTGSALSPSDYEHANGEAAIGSGGILSQFYYNASNTEFGLDSKGNASDYPLPKSGYDGQVAVLPGQAIGKYSEMQEQSQPSSGVGLHSTTVIRTIVAVDVRDKLIKHELYENYLRATGQQYIPAHNGANKAGYSIPMLSNFTYRK